MKRSALPPITRREKVRPSRWSEQAEGGRPKAREIFKGVLLVSRLSLSGARLQFALGALAWRARRPSLPPTLTSPDLEAVQSQNLNFQPPPSFCRN